MCSIWYRLIYKILRRRIGFLLAFADDLGGPRPNLDSNWVIWKIPHKMLTDEGCKIVCLTRVQKVVLAWQRFALLGYHMGPPAGIARLFVVCHKVRRVCELLFYGASTAMVISTKVRQSYISRTVWPRITKLDAYIHTDVLNSHTGHDITGYSGWQLMPPRRLRVEFLENG